MTDTQVQEGNKLIDKFMGRETSNWHPSHKRKGYDNDWDYLMPVVEKIFETIQNEEVNWIGLKDEDNISCLTIFATKEMVWNAVIQFIQWYNQTKSK